MDLTAKYNNRWNQLVQLMDYLYLVHLGAPARGVKNLPGERFQMGGSRRIRFSPNVTCCPPPRRGKSTMEM